MTEYNAFKEVVARLRAEDGCPWDREQTHSSLKPGCIEEASEVLCAINILEETGNSDNLKEELGDLLLQVVMHAQIAEEEGQFTLEDVIREIREKMIRRHPHVFGETSVTDSGDVLEKWAEIKKQEKTGKEWMEQYLPPAFDEAEQLIEKARVRKAIHKEKQKNEKNSGAGKVYFIRHGQTIWNVENKICGATDIKLTEYGHEQAVHTGKLVLKKGIRADEILYSPLQRAAETAMHIAEVTGIPARMEPRLKEQNFGKYESTARDGAEFAQAKKEFGCRYEGGESMMQLAQRIYNLLDEIRSEADEKTYILVAHNGISRMIHSYFHEMTNEEFAGFGVKNCEVLEYEFV